jgi:hypothetical protein
MVWVDFQIRPAWESHCTTYPETHTNDGDSSLAIFVNRRDQRPCSKGKKGSGDKLRKLDAVSPARTLEEWCSKTKGSLLPSEGVDGQFVW